MPIEWGPDEVRLASEVLIGVTQTEAVNAITTLLARGALRRDEVAELSSFDTQSTRWRVHPFLGRIPGDTAWRLDQAEIVGVLTPSLRALADPTARGRLPFSSLRFPEPMLVDGIDVDGHVLWGMTLRLLDDLVPRLLAGEWDI